MKNVYLSTELLHNETVHRIEDHPRGALIMMIYQRLAFASANCKNYELPADIQQLASLLQVKPAFLAEALHVLAREGLLTKNPSQHTIQIPDTSFMMRRE